MSVSEMNIRAKYATNTAKGVDIDEALETIETTIGDEDSGLVKAVADLDTEKQDALTTESVPDGTIDDVIGFDDNGDIVKGTIEGGTKWTKIDIRDGAATIATKLASATVPYILLTNDTAGTNYILYRYDSTYHRYYFIQLKPDGQMAGQYDYSHVSLICLDSQGQRVTAEEFAQDIKKLYMHYLRLAVRTESDRNTLCCCTIYCSKSDAFTKTTLKQFLKDNSLNNLSHGYGLGMTWTRQEPTGTLKVINYQELAYNNNAAQVYAQIVNYAFDFTNGAITESSSAGWFNVDSLDDYVHPIP